MLFLKSFTFPKEDEEHDFIMSIMRTCYNNFYPFRILSNIGLERIDFEPLTIIYGGNGSGKSTVLNIIAEKLGLKRDSIYNRSSFYEDYLKLCQKEIYGFLPESSRIITSDDVFDYMLSLRSINEGIDLRREEVFQEYLDAKYADFRLESLEDYEELKKINTARRLTQSKYTKENLMKNVRTHSNGENAYRYFTEKIEEDALYLLDEPENSLSAKRQKELAKFIEDSVRFFSCQFIISSHSPFILSIPGAKIYNLDEDPVNIEPWTELENVRAFYDFFKENKNKF